MATNRRCCPAGVSARAGSLSTSPSTPPAESRPLVIISTRSGCAATRPSSVSGFMPFQPISSATSYPPIASISESAPEPSPNM